MEARMPKRDELPTDRVKKSTMLGVAAICLAVGFFGGVIFSVYKSKPRLPQQGFQTQVNQAAPDRSAELDALVKETAQNPENVNAWIELGNLYFDTNQFDKSIWSYQKALELNPNNPNVLTDMGVMYRRKGQPEEAVKAFDRAMKVDPKHEISRFNKGIVLLHDLNKPVEAIAAWEDLLKVNPFAMAPNGKSVDELITIYKKNLANQEQ